MTNMIARITNIAVPICENIGYSEILLGQSQKNEFLVIFKDRNGSGSVIPVKINPF